MGLTSLFLCAMLGLQKQPQRAIDYPPVFRGYEYSMGVDTGARFYLGGYRKRTHAVRLDGLWVPQAGESGYSGSKLELDTILGDHAQVAIDFEPNVPSYRGDALVYAWAWGKNLNVAMLESGWAKLDPRYKGRYLKEFQAAEAEARSLKFGLWASSGR